MENISYPKVPVSLSQKKKAQWDLHKRCYKPQEFTSIQRTEPGKRERKSEREGAILALFSSIHRGSVSRPAGLLVAPARDKHSRGASLLNASLNI